MNCITSLENTTFEIVINRITEVLIPPTVDIESADTWVLESKPDFLIAEKLFREYASSPPRGAQRDAAVANRVRVGDDYYTFTSEQEGEGEVVFRFGETDTMITFTVKAVPPPPPTGCF